MAMKIFHSLKLDYVENFTKNEQVNSGRDFRNRYDSAHWKFIQKSVVRCEFLYNTQKTNMK